MLESFIYLMYIVWMFFTQGSVSGVGLCLSKSCATALRSCKLAGTVAARFVPQLTVPYLRRQTRKGGEGRVRRAASG